MTVISAWLNVKIKNRLNDRVLQVLGVPHTEGLGLENVGITTDERGAFQWTASELQSLAFMPLVM